MKVTLAAAWTRFAERFDALPTRDRAAAFAGAIVVVALALIWLVVTPAVNGGRAAARELDRKRDEVAALREQSQKLAAELQRDPDEAMRRRIDVLRERLTATEQRLDAWRRQLIAPDRMAGLLRELLARNRGLELLEMKSIAPEVISGEVARAVQGPEPKNVTTGAGEAPAGKAAATTMPIYRHGLELRVRGTYLNQLRYLTELERMPQRMFWRNVEITSESYPEVEMRLTVYTLSLDRAYLSL